MSLAGGYLVTVNECVPMAWRLGKPLDNGDWPLDLELDLLDLSNHLNDSLLDLFRLFDLDSCHYRLGNVDHFPHLLLNLSHAGNFADHIVSVVLCSGNV